MYSNITSFSFPLTSFPRISVILTNFLSEANSFPKIICPATLIPSVEYTPAPSSHLMSKTCSVEVVEFHNLKIILSFY